MEKKYLYWYVGYPGKVAMTVIFMIVSCRSFDWVISQKKAELYDRTGAPLPHYRNIKHHISMVDYVHSLSYYFAAPHTPHRTAPTMTLTGRQLAGAFAALGLALGIFWPTSPPHGGDRSSDASSTYGYSGGCPLGYGAAPNDKDDASGAHHRGHGEPTSTSLTAGVRIFTNASIWTGDATVPWAEAMAVTDAGRGKGQRRWPVMITSPPKLLL